MADYSKYLDQQLVALLRENDRHAFNEIYARYFWLLHTHAHKWIRDREETKDLIQEVFLTVWEKRQALKPELGLSAYLYTSVRNRVFNRLSRQQVAAAYLASLDDYLDKGEYITDHLVREKELKRIIEEGIDSMPRKMQEVFRLSREENLSHKEIAERLKLSEQTVRKHIQHALRILRIRITMYAVIVAIGMI